MVKTSIIIPVKNDVSIYNCINSILKQIRSKKDREVIIVNDKNSEEEFSKNLKKFCKEKKIKYIKGEKPGAAFNRNKGMAIAKGENILFIDSDCIAGPNWIKKMEDSLKDYDIVEGAIIYNSQERPLFDRVIENKETPYRFLTANLGIKKAVAKKCSFDERFIVFREDTDFGLCALEKGFKSFFNKEAKVFHKKSRFSIREFIFERKRFIGDPLLFKKHRSNKLLKKHIPIICRISYPLELILLIFIFISIFLSWKLFLVAYFFPGIIYSLKKYLIDKRTFKIKDTFLVILLIPLTMIVKRISIWRGSIKFKVLLI